MTARAPFRVSFVTARAIPRAVPHTVLTLALALSAAAPAPAQQSVAMRSDCRNVAPNTPESRRRAEQWVQQKLQAFLPSPEEALRMERLQEHAQQAELAFFNIATTCEEYRAGSRSRDDADALLRSAEQTIADFLHELDGELSVLASTAQVADLGRIRSFLAETGAIGRQAALMGEDALADQSRQQMVDTLVRFSEAFVDRTCWDQVFDEELPFSIQRQNDVLGTGIDVLPCAQRRFHAEASPLFFDSCTVRGVGEWRVLWPMVGPGITGGRGSGRLENERDGAKGDYRVDWAGNGVAYRASGEMELARRDNGPGKKASYTLAGEIDIRLTEGEKLVRDMAKLMNQKIGGRTRFSVTPDVSDKPCKSLDD